MSQTSTGTRSEPQFASAGNPPTFAADLSLVATFAAQVGIRTFATQAAMNSSTGSASGEWAKVTAIPGALFQYNGTTWVMAGVPSFSSAAAVSAAITVPAQGMMVYRSDLARNLIYLTTGGNVAVAGWYPAGGSVPMCRVGLSAAQNSGTSAAAVTWHTEQFDTDGFHSTSSNTSRFTVPAGLNGTFRIEAQLAVAITSGIARSQIYKNGSAIADSLKDDWAGIAAANPVIHVDYDIQLFAGDYIELWTSNSVGTEALTVTRAWATLRYLGPL